MSNAYEPQSYSEDAIASNPPSSGGGGKCLLYGCLGSVLLILLVCGGAGLGGYFWATGLIKNYTAEAPEELPVVELSEEEVEQIKQRSVAFKEAIEEGETPEPLVLTADEINAMIADNPEMKGRVFVEIADGTISGRVSVPVDFVPGGKGRFFNGSAKFEASVDNGFLSVRIVEADVNGEPLPDEFVNGMSSQNLAKDLPQNNPEAAEFFRHMDSLTVEGDKIILTPKPQADQTEAEKESGEGADGEAGDDAPANSESGETEGGDATGDDSSEPATEEASVEVSESSATADASDEDPVPAEANN